MTFVYILKSLVKDITYTGSTNDLERRIGEHNSGKCDFTNKYKPWQIIHKEEFKNLHEARLREKYLKSCSGRKFIKEIFKK